MNKLIIVALIGAFCIMFGLVSGKEIKHILEGAKHKVGDAIHRVGDRIEYQTDKFKSVIEQRDKYRPKRDILGGGIEGRLSLSPLTV